MQFLLKITYPNTKFSEAVRDGSIGAKMARLIEDLKPKAMYFLEMDGLRTTIAIVEIQAASQIPAIAEPLYLVFDAKVEWHPLMELPDLQQSGLEELGRKWAAV